MPEPWKIAVICVLFNPEQSDYENLAACARLGDMLILIDNSPEDHGAQAERLIRARAETPVRYQKMPGNEGLCRGINAGAEIAWREGFRWCLYMDQDSRPHGDILEVYRRVLEGADEAGIAVLGPQFLFDRRKAKAASGVRPAKWLMTSGNLLNVAILRELGGFDERYWLDVLDIEYGLRANRAGYKVLECREAMIDHHPAQTKTKRIFGLFPLKYGYDQPIRYYYCARNLLDVVRRYGDLGALGMLLMKFAKIVLLFDRKKAFFRAYRAGLMDCVRGVWGRKDSSFL